MNDRQISISINQGTIVQAILLVLLVALLFYLKDLVLIVLTAIVLASAIEPGAQWFIRRRIPRVISVLLVYLLTLGFIFAIFYLFVPPLLNDVANFISVLPSLIGSIDFSGISQSVFFQPGEVAQTLTTPDFIKELQSSFTSFSGGFLRTVSGVFGGIVSFILIVVFSFYFAMQETGIDDFLRVITPVRHQQYVVNLWKRSQQKIGRWMQGQIVLALIVGILVYLGLTVLGVRYALVLAVFAALAELIPVFGPIIAAVPAVGIAFVDGGPTLGLLVVGLYLIIQQFENHLIYPLVVKKVVGVPPLMVILSLLVGAQLAGFLGILLSVPIAAAIQELITDIQKQKANELAHVRDSA